MPRFAPMKRYQARQARVAANDNSPHSIYSHSSELEDLLGRLHGAGDPARRAQTALDRFKCRIVMAVVAVVLVAAWVPAGAAAIGFLKSRYEYVEPLADKPLIEQRDRLISQSPVAAPSIFTADAELFAGLNPTDDFRGSIAGINPMVDRTAQPAHANRPRKRTADRVPQPIRVNTLSPAPARTPTPSSPSNFETIFGLRTLFGQTSPQT
jgi:hypothetical protein